MKTIFIILLFLIPLQLPAQTDRELLLINNAKIEAMDKRFDAIDKRFEAMDKRFEAMDKRFDAVNQRFDATNQRFTDADKRMDILLYIMIAILAGIFGLITTILWDRRAVAKPFESKAEELQKENLELKKEIAIIKEKEIILEEKQLKNEHIFKKIAEIDTRFAGIGY